MNGIGHGLSDEFGPNPWLHWAVGLGLSDELGPDPSPWCPWSVGHGLSEELGPNPWLLASNACILLRRFETTSCQSVCSVSLLSLVCSGGVASVFNLDIVDDPRIEQHHLTL